MCTKRKGNIHTIKSLLKDHPSPVYNSLLGNALTNKNLVVLENHQIIMRRDHQSMKGKVKLIGGGGAGTEPAEAYFVGKGMLTAAVVGDIFTAPSAHEILVAIRELAEEGCDGILLLVKNYVGDRINFSLALEKAVEEDILVKMLIIGEDINESAVGHQGLAGSVLIYKIAGEMAEQGKTLEEIIDECTDQILPDLVTVSATMSPCTSTICDSLMKFIRTSDMILGMGIYGKGGAKRITITDLKSAILVITEEMQSFFQKDSESYPFDVVVLINNLGGTSKLEEALIANEVTKELNDLGLKIVQLYVGTFMSSLDTQGFSVSVLKVNFSDTLKYLNAPTSAPGWPGNCNSGPDITSGSSQLPIVVPAKFQHEQLDKQKIEKMSFGPVLSEKATAALKQIAIFASEALISCEKQLNIIDSEAGDGDAGSVLKKAADALKKAVVNDAIDMTRPGKFLYELSEICCRSMGGLSGALYSVFFSSAAKAFQDAEEITPEVCCTAFKSAVEAMQQHGKSELGDRTVLDVLCPAANAFESALINGKDFSEAVYLAATTCEFKSEETKSMKPLFLQIMNISQPLLYADAGAHAATIWLRAINEAFDSEIPTKRPGIFLWKFITEEDANFALDPDVSSEEIMSMIEKKVGPNQTLLSILLHETLTYSRKHFKNHPKRTSAFVSTIYFTHKYFTASRWRPPADVYYYFRESILCQSIEQPPTSMEIFEPEQARDVILFFFETYLRNLPLVRILHLPHYKLRLNLPEASSVRDRRFSSKGEKKK